MRFAVLGRTRMLYESVGACLRAGHEAVLVATSPAAPEYDVRERDFEALAAELNCSYFCATRLDSPQQLALLREARAEVAISVNWPTRIGAPARAQFTHGVVNAHAGDLPRYRGNACPNWAILEGEERVVLSLHVMADELDAGPLLAQRALPLKASTYIRDVYDFLERTVPELFAEVLTGLEQGTAKPREQPRDPRLSLRCYPRRPEDGEIEWSHGAERIARLVRATAEPFAGAFGWLEDTKVTIWRARAEPLPQPSLGMPGHVVEIGGHAGEVAVLTGAGLLVLETVERGSSGRMRAADVITSTRQRFVGRLAALEGRLRALEERVADS
jgi:methionyl-tRNA formyltransferase